MICLFHKYQLLKIEERFAYFVDIMECNKCEKIKEMNCVYKPMKCLDNPTSEEIKYLFNINLLIEEGEVK